MGLFSKMKDILFEEEEVTEPIPKVKSTKEEKRVEPKRVVEDKPISRQIQPEKKVEMPKPEPPKRNSLDDTKERNLFRSESTFPFPDFDEDEFNNSVTAKRPEPPVRAERMERLERPERIEPVKSSTNVLEYEKKKRAEKRAAEYSRPEKNEIREITTERKRFKPSPIISPVYGILNEDYKIEDIRERRDNHYPDSLDIDSVRKKAFGTHNEIKEEPREVHYKEEAVTIAVKEKEEEKIEKTKTIDELLESTADDMIEIEDDDKTPTQSTKKEYDEIDDELEELINHPKENKASEPKFEDDDTLENDLFDLIDSMYDSREDGEF